VPIKGSYTGATGVAYETVIGYKIVGTPKTAGTYNVTITLIAPYVINYNNWYMTIAPWGDYTYTETITITVT
jgi:hypothetical protein